jgi:hypothetical protein
MRAGAFDWYYALPTSARWLHVRNGSEMNGFHPGASTTVADSTLHKCRRILLFIIIIIDWLFIIYYYYY